MLSLVQKKGGTHVLVTAARLLCISTVRVAPLDSGMEITSYIDWQDQLVMPQMIFNVSHAPSDRLVASIILEGICE